MTAVLLQNMTEGPTTPAMRHADVVLASEVHRGRFRSGFPDRFGTYCPIKAPHLGIAWDTRTVKNVRPGALRFHDSGKDEGWAFRTPPRGLAWIKCEMDGEPWVFWVTWLLNSWHPVKPDQFTAARRAVVLDLELPVVRRKVIEWDQRGFHQAGGGDMNTVKAPAALELPRLDMVADEGLDRAYLSSGLRGRLERRTMKVDTTAKTGVGSDMRHEGVRVRWAA